MHDISAPAPPSLRRTGRPESLNLGERLSKSYISVKCDFLIERRLFMNRKMIRVNINVERATHEKFKKVAKKGGFSTSRLIQYFENRVIEMTPKQMAALFKKVGRLKKK